MDLGTGDGRLPYAGARRAPERLFLGIDASAAGMREVSGRAWRARLENVAFVRAALDDLPDELTAVAGEVTVVLPWGRLLAAVACPDPMGLRAMRRLCTPGARLTVVLALDASRDGGELRRLGLPGLDAAHLAGPLPERYPAGGFVVRRVRPLTPAGLSEWPSTWARRLAHGGARPAVRIDAQADGA